VRLRWHLQTTASDDSLREFAREELGASRTGQPYLRALRVVLGNQAEAERGRYTLELNIRTDFATERVMRNIIDQMKVAGITEGKLVSLGEGKVQLVQCYPHAHAHSRNFCQDLNAMLRDEEDRLEAGRCTAAWDDLHIVGIPTEDVPF
jgi:hypothetical protein